MSTYVIKNLASLGNKVITIRKSDTFEKVNEFEFGIRQHVEDDMAQLLQVTIKDAGVGLEGIVYLWGLHPLNENEDLSLVAQPFLYLCKSIITQDSPKLFVVTKSVTNVGDNEPALPSSSPLWAMTKCFQNEQPNAIARCIDLDDSLEISDHHMKEVFSEFMTNDNEVYAAYRNGQRFVPRFIPWKPQNTGLRFPKSEKFRLILPASNAINDLRWVSYSQ